MPSACEGLDGLFQSIYPYSEISQPVYDVLHCAFAVYYAEDMSDPLTSFANEEDDIEKNLDEMNDDEKNYSDTAAESATPSDVIETSKAEENEKSDVADDAEQTKSAGDDEEEDEFLASPRSVGVSFTLVCWFFESS